MVTYFSLVDLFTSMKCTLTVDAFCRHFLVPHNLLALASMTLNVFQHHTHHTLFFGLGYWQLTVCWIPHKFLAHVSLPVTQFLQPVAVQVSYRSTRQVAMLSFTVALLFLLTFLPSSASNFLSELEVVLTRVAPGQ
jgi:integral membrane sensor domain MASE1